MGEKFKQAMKMKNKTEIIIISYSIFETAKYRVSNRACAPKISLAGEAL
jgi:hypothetical protein